jgi:DNA-binding NarL/FixJ family response regulator
MGSAGVTAGAKLLVVDDDPGIREGLLDLLGLYGFKVRTAADGAEALQMVEQDPPDLILSDIIMPGMDGYQFLDRIHARREWRGIPFVFLTARGEIPDVRRGLELGAEDYIMKPFEPQDLAAAVLAVLAGSGRSRGQGEDSHEAGPPADPAGLEGEQELIGTLTAREREVLRLIASGKRNTDIADQLAIQLATVRRHVSSIFSKLGVGSRVEAATAASALGLSDPGE